MRPTAELQQRIVQEISKGSPVEVAARCAGVPARTLRGWLRRGERDHGGMYQAFRDAVEAACLAVVCKDAKKDSRLAMWLLERRAPERGRRRRRRRRSQS